MILHRVEAANVGPFTGAPAMAGPFAPGLNILSAPNETGKSTLLKAAGRALFDRHTCKDAEMFSLQPVGTELAPRVSVEFGTAEGRFKVEKTFLRAPTSTLHEHLGGGWQPVAEGDEADKRLTRLLQSQHPGKGATKAAAHWGMLGYLWMRQGELSAWPEWTGNPAGQLVQSLLVKVEIDPFIETVRRRMWSAYQENFTATGQPKAGGTLREAQEILARVEFDLVRIAAERQRLAADEEEYARLSEGLPDLEAEHAHHRAEAAELQETARRAEVAAEEVQRRQHALTTAQDHLRAVQADRDAAGQHARDLEEARRRLLAAEAAAERAVQEAADRRVLLADAERAAEAAELALTRLQAEGAHVARQIRRRRSHENVERLTRLLERADAQSRQVQSLERARGELPSVAPGRLQLLQKTEDAIRQRRAQIDALGLTVELTSDADAAGVRVCADGSEGAFLDLRAGETGTVRAARDLALELPGWGQLRMRSGAAETRNLDDAVKKDEATLRDGLAEHGAGTVAALRDLAARAQRIDAEIAAARQALAAILDRDRSPDALRQGLAAESRGLAILENELGLPPDAPLPSHAELEAAEQDTNVRLEQARTGRETFARQLKKIRETSHEAAAAREAAERALIQRRADADGLTRQGADLLRRYPDGIEAAFEAAALAYGEAKYTLQQAQEKLPSDAASLGERNRRAAAAAAQVGAELDAKRRARDELRGRLEWLGAQALYPRETELLAEQSALTAQLERARARGHAARLVHDLIERRKHAATRTVLGPLQERLGARFAEVSGERDRQIFLDESLRIRGLGRKEADLVAFDELSQGAKEQLLLCLRLVVAEELAATPAGGPQSLVLDDVLVNTDVARQRRVLAVLADAAAGGLQILVCTCHPDRYRGVGEIVNLRRA